MCVSDILPWITVHPSPRVYLVCMHARIIPTSYIYVCVCVSCRESHGLCCVDECLTGGWIESLIVDWRLACVHDCLCAWWLVCV